MKILLVEDDISASTVLVELLKANHYTIDLANNGKTGLDMAIAAKYDLILLDWLLPQLDGLSLCRQLRSQGYQEPILLLTAKNGNADIVAGLDAGADDYMIKPYAPEALLAKMRSLLRRRGRVAFSELTWANLSLDPYSAKVNYNGQAIALTATEYKLLELFLQNPDRIFSRRMILDRLWNFDDAPIENAVTTHIKDLRKKLKAGGLQTEILETVYGMGYRLKPPPPNPELYTATNQPTPQKQHPQPKSGNSDFTSVHRVIAKFRDSFSQQVAVLEQAKIALLAETLSEELQQQAAREAHKLAGTMGSFGYPEGSRLARKLENLLLCDRLSTDEKSQFCQLVTALQQELTQPPVNLKTQPAPQHKADRVLVIAHDQVLMAQLLAEADAWGMQIQIAPDLTTARSHLSLATFQVVLLDLSFPGTEQGLTLLRELQTTSPHLPIVVFTARDSLSDRLAVSRLGARQFLPKGATTKQIFQTLNRVLSTSKPAEAKVLIVDDDPTMLIGLSDLLIPWGLAVTTLDQPQRFWQVLTATSPDLVLLDLEMPIVNGLELCQVVRQDAYWGDLPILVVTAHTEAHFLQQAFAAGADDFITKPVLGPELVTRVISRIDRTRLRLDKDRKRELGEA